MICCYDNDFHFQLYPGHFGHYVIRLQILLNLLFKQAVTLLRRSAKAEWVVHAQLSSGARQKQTPKSGGLTYATLLRIGEHSVLCTPSCWKQGTKVLSHCIRMEVQTQLPFKSCWRQGERKQRTRSHCLTPPGSGQKTRLPSELCWPLGWGVRKYWLIQSPAQWEWRLDFPDTSLAGESEQRLLLVETSAPLSVPPKQSGQENQSANASAERETEDQLPTRSHWLSWQENRSTSVCFHRGGDKRGIEDQLPVCPL